MLQNTEANHHILTDVLLETYMLSIYFTTLIATEGKDIAKRQLGTLHFLDALER